MDKKGKRAIQVKMAFILFDRMTTLDFIGFFDAVTRLQRLQPEKGHAWDICAVQPEVTDDRGLTFKVQKVLPDLGVYDLLFCPGGMGTRELRFDEGFLSWLRTAESVPHKISVCTGSLLLGAAGFLQGKRATTNPAAYDLLEPYCGELVKARIVRDRNIVTGGAVAAAVDLGLYMVETFTDEQTVRKVMESMDYPYYRPGSAGTDYMLQTVK
jgi:transcriptional regulator GlxA family with amidase domain